MAQPTRNTTRHGLPRGLRVFLPALCIGVFALSTAAPASAAPSSRRAASAGHTGSAAPAGRSAPAARSHRAGPAASRRAPAPASRRAAAQPARRSAAQRSPRSARHSAPAPASRSTAAQPQRRASRQAARPTASSRSGSVARNAATPASRRAPSPSPRRAAYAGRDDGNAFAARRSASYSAASTRRASSRRAAYSDRHGDHHLDANDHGDHADDHFVNADAAHHQIRSHHPASHNHHAGSHRSHHAGVHHGYSYGYGYGYGHPHYSIGLHFGSHGHSGFTYYRPYHHDGGYTRYGYGYGYSPRYRGYYSGYYDYAPSASYAYTRPYYDDSYSPNGAYYYPSVAASPAPYSPPARAYKPATGYTGQPFADGWDDLAHGSDRSAFRYFSKAAARHADDGAPKVGYALAAAMLGDQRRAAWAMRRALTTDPYSLSALRFDERLLGRLDRLAEHYADAADHAHNGDADFMLAALSTLLHDDDLARIAIDSAIEHGDRSDAARILRDMIPDTAGYDDN